MFLYVYDGKLESAINLCKDTDSPSARMIEKGITRLGRPMSDVQVAVENVGNIEIAKLEKHLGLLATVSGGAPMLGFLGTVLGMVQAFFEMEQAGGNTINLSQLAGGIYTAMVTTVAGLIIGVCAYFAYMQKQNYTVKTKLLERLDSEDYKTLKYQVVSTFNYEGMSEDTTVSEIVYIVYDNAAGKIVNFTVLGDYFDAAVRGITDSDISIDDYEARVFVMTDEIRSRIDELDR